MTDLTPTWYVIYKTSNGEVVRTGLLPKDMIATYPSGSLPSGCAIIEAGRVPNGSDGEWVVGGVLTTPTTMPATISKTSIVANGFDEAVVSGIPNPSTVSVVHSHPEASTFPASTVTDGTARITTTKAGTISVIVTSQGYTRKAFLINAV